MLENNNQRIIRKMAKRSMQGNTRRNSILIASIALSAFMLITVLTVGITYFKAQRDQTIRMYGGVHDAVLMAPSGEQIEKCRNDSRIEEAGLTVKCASAESNGVDDSLHTTFIWSDGTYWDVQKRPALKWIKGEYPKQENELMISMGALKECGSENGKIGDRLTLTYGDKNGKHKKEFIISGIYEDYSGETAAYVSEKFYRTTGHKPSDVTAGVMYLSFSRALFTDKQLDTFREELNLGKQQRLLYTGITEHSLSVFLGILGLVFVTCVCSYLLVYNILYLSVTNNIRYYGLLQTVGMTERQIHKMLYRQMFLLGGAGIVLGLVVGSGTAFIIIPGIVKTIGIRGGAVSVSFHPLVYAAAVLVSCLTIYFGSRKPAKIAGRISPVEAVRYTAPGGGRKKRRTGKGSIAGRMARTNLLKDRKRSAIVILSLTLSVSIFICVITIIQSQGARTMVSNFMDFDLELSNDTLGKEDESQYRQIFDKDFITALDESKGIREIYPLYLDEITVPWEPDFAEIWMREEYATWMDYPYAEARDEYKKNPDKFYSYITGIDEMLFDRLKETLSQPVDKEAFMTGEVCILYRNDLSLTEKDIEGKTLTFYLKKTGEEGSVTLPIGGMTDENYYSPYAGLAPVIIVSQQFLHRLNPEAYIQKLGILYQEEYDESAEAQALGIAEESPYSTDIESSSKIESMKRVKESQGNMMEFGLGIVLILALIGIMNYVNTVCSSIQNRLGELAVLESIGMTERQMKKMLVQEGLLFAGSSLLLSSTVGIGVTYVIYQSVNYMDVGFYFPLIPVLGVYVLVILVCICVPLLLYHYSIRGKSAVERLQESQG